MSEKWVENREQRISLHAADSDPYFVSSFFVRFTLLDSGFRGDSTSVIDDSLYLFELYG
jgi:hypothetical protein